MPNGNPIAQALSNFGRSLQTALLFEAQRREHALRGVAQEQEAARGLEALKLQGQVQLGDVEVARAREARRFGLQEEEIGLRRGALDISRGQLGVQQQAQRAQEASQIGQLEVQRGHLGVAQRQLELQAQRQTALNALSQAEARVRAAQAGSLEDQRTAEREARAVPIPMPLALELAEGYGASPAERRLLTVLAEHNRPAGTPQDMIPSGTMFDFAKGLSALRASGAKGGPTDADDLKTAMAFHKQEGVPLNTREVYRTKALIQQYRADPEGTEQQVDFESAYKEAVRHEVLAVPELFSAKDIAQLSQAGGDPVQAARTKIAAETNPGRKAAWTTNLQIALTRAAQRSYTTVHEKYGERLRLPIPREQIPPPSAAAAPGATVPRAPALAEAIPQPQPGVGEPPVPPAPTSPSAMVLQDVAQRAELRQALIQRFGPTGPIQYIHRSPEKVQRYLELRARGMDAAQAFDLVYPRR